MFQNRLRNLGGPAEGSSVSVADVERIRRQRRLASTDDEQAAVRAYLRALAGGVRSEPGSNSQFLKIIGIALIVIGLTVGIFLFFVAGAIWPHYVEFTNS